MIRTPHIRCSRGASGQAVIFMCPGWVPAASSNSGVCSCSTKSAPGSHQRMTAEMRALAMGDDDADDAPDERGQQLHPRSAVEFSSISLHALRRHRGRQTTESRRLCAAPGSRTRASRRFRTRSRASTTRRSGLDLEFEGPQGTYLFDGLSSGQVMILLLLLRCAKSPHPQLDRSDRRAGICTSTPSLADPRLPAAQGTRERQPVLLHRALHPPARPDPRGASFHFTGPARRHRPPPKKRREMSEIWLPLPGRHRLPGSRLGLHHALARPSCPSLHGVAPTPAAQQST